MKRFRSLTLEAFPVTDLAFDLFFGAALSVWLSRASEKGKGEVSGGMRSL